MTQFQTGLNAILEKSYFKNEQKNKYSFGKSQRFPEIKSNNTIDFYNAPSLRSTRVCSFGFGNKTDISKNQHYPSAFEYSISAQKKNGYSFGVSRQNIKVNDYLYNPSLLKNPSSDKYNPIIQYSSKYRSTPKCIMLKKLAVDSFIQPSQNPEPGKYDPKIEENGKTLVSNFKTAKKAVFSRSTRFIPEHQQLDVGSGQYNPKADFESRNRATKNTVFYNAARKTFAIEAIEKSITPGPIYYVS